MRAYHGRIAATLSAVLGDPSIGTRVRVKRHPVKLHGTAPLTGNAHRLHGGIHFRVTIDSDRQALAFIPLAGECDEAVERIMERLGPSRTKRHTASIRRNAPPRVTSATIKRSQTMLLNRRPHLSRSNP